MTGRLERRVARLEQRSAPSWRAWAGVPLREWTDEMLEALICGDSGEQLRQLTDDELRALLAKAETADADDRDPAGAAKWRES